MVQDSIEEKRVVDNSWNFKDANTKEYTHGFHSYPAMMIPQIARRLIEEYGNNAQVILDPFMGSGSSLVEASLRSHTQKIYGLEINPLALLISKVKTTTIPPYELELKYNKIKETLSKTTKQEKPLFYNLDFWFKPKVIEELAKLKHCINKIQEPAIKDFFKVCFSETARLASNTRNGEFKLYRIPENKLSEYNPDALKTFEKIAKRNIKQMEQFYNNQNGRDIQVYILKEDARGKTSIPNNACDFLVTSPPYGDSRTTVAYGQFSRLSSQWLGYDETEIKNVDKNGLGGIPVKELANNLHSSSLNAILEEIKEKDSKRAKDVLAFYVDFDKCTEEINRVMKHGSFLCFVVGNRTVKRVNIPTDKIIAELFVNKFGYKHHKTIIREIPSKRMPKANSPSNKKGDLVSTMNHEFIVVLQK